MYKFYELIPQNQLLFKNILTNITHKRFLVFNTCTMHINNLPKYGRQRKKHFIHVSLFVSVLYCIR